MLSVFIVRDGAAAASVVAACGNVCVTCAVFQGRACVYVLYLFAFHVYHTHLMAAAFV